MRRVGANAFDFGELASKNYIHGDAGDNQLQSGKLEDVLAGGGAMASLMVELEMTPSWIRLRSFLLYMTMDNRGTKSKLEFSIRNWPYGP